MAIYSRCDLQWAACTAVAFIARRLAHWGNRVKASLADRLFSFGLAELAGLWVSFTRSGMAKIGRHAVKVDLGCSAPMKFTVPGPQLTPAEIGLGIR